MWPNIDLINSGGIIPEYVVPLSTNKDKMLAIGRVKVDIGGEQLISFEMGPLGNDIGIFWFCELQA